ncbi:MAG: FecR family protein [Betaproteobacteria bacterium]|nr:FecR family protein [Betaproteobacteria bacterium]MDH5352389.1 FecR family protein [Betaproteobacteria bacterium]
MSFLPGGILAAMLLASSHAHASAIVESLNGEMRAGDSTVLQGARISSGATLVLGPEAKATLKFDDGMRIVLDRSTTFRIADFSFKAAEPGGDRAVFDLTRGAMRMVTGTIGKRSPQSLALRAPHATVQVRGTDYMVALVNPAFLQVLAGSIAAANGAGTVVFGQKAFGEIAGRSSLAVPTTESAVPAAAISAFARLLEGLDVAAAVPPDGTAAGAGAAAAEAPTAGAPGAVLFGVGAAIIWAITNSGSTTSH